MTNLEINDLYNKISPSYNKLDLVILYVNNNDPVWRKEFLYYKNKELEEKKTIHHTQSTSIRRFRSWNNLKYVFRGIEKNIPWINNVFLILSGETQIPKWLNIKHPKLRIVYHKNFIPEKLLPTFNSLTIQAFDCFIEELHDYFIDIDDDMFFLNPLPKEFFIDNGCFQLDFTSRDSYFDPGNSYFKSMLNNTYQYELPLYKKFPILFSSDSHLPEVQSKKLNLEFLKKENNIEELTKKFSVSKFRSTNNIISNWFYRDLLKFNCDRIPFKNRTGKYQEYKCEKINLIENIDFDKYSQHSICCFNDCYKTTEDEKKFNDIKNRLNTFLEKKFPEKSNYEK